MITVIIGKPFESETADSPPHRVAYDWQKEDPEFSKEEGSAPSDKRECEHKDEADGTFFGLPMPSFSQMAVVYLIAFVLMAALNYWTGNHKYFVSFAYSYDGAAQQISRYTLDYAGPVTTRKAQSFISYVERDIASKIIAQWSGNGMTYDRDKLQVNILYYREVERSWLGWVFAHYD